MIRTNPAPIAARLALTLCAALAVTFLAACGDKKDPAATQTAARINKGEVTVHQINFVLQQQRGLRPEQADAAGKQILERLIDQELAVQKADDLKLDRDPKVVQALEAARREVLARAYFEKVGEAAAKPTPEDVKKFYDANPQLFSQRRIYNLQEFLIEARPEQVTALREKLQGIKQVSEFVDYLKAQNLRFAVNQAVRAAEQLPAPVQLQLAKMSDGQAVFTQAPAGVQVMLIAGSRQQPVTEEQARPAIEQLLLAERRGKLQQEDVKAMRSAAKITYVGKYAESAASAPAGATAPAAPAEATAAAAAAPAPALSASEVSKGMGLK